jgi:hypothetical protein
VNKTCVVDVGWTVEADIEALEKELATAVEVEL